jgi:hypothetical protein
VFVSPGMSILGTRSSWSSIPTGHAS